MRKILLIAITTLFTIHVWGQTADKIIVKDTRDINDGPNQFVQEVIFEFKRRSTLGIPGTGSYSGMMTFAPWKDDSGDASHQLNFNEGGIYYRTGQPSETNWDIWRQLIITDENGYVGIGTTTPDYQLDVIGRGQFINNGDNIRLKSSNSGVSAITYLSFFESDNTALGYVGIPASSNNDLYLTSYNNNIRLFAGGTSRLLVHSNGNVGIGTTNPTYLLSVKGTIGCGEVIVENVTGWADFVFEDNYHLMPLQELDSYIQENKHLPEIPTTAEVEENGISVGEMNVKLLQKIEELTLYTIEQQKEINKLKNLENELNELKIIINNMNK